MKKLCYNLLALRHRSGALAQLRRLEQKLPSPASRFAVPFVFRGCGHFKSMEPRQNPTEIEALYHAVCELQPRRVLEIGTAKGGSLYLWTQAATPDATIVSVDLPEGDFGGAYPVCRVEFYQAFARPGQSMHLLRADSHKPETLAEVKKHFAAGSGVSGDSGDSGGAGGPIDFAFIDGDHTYDGVKADFLQYGPLVRPGGLIGFHDILPRPDMPTIQVDRLWSELRACGRYECRDLVGAEGSGRRIGIGLLKVPPGGVTL